MPTELKVDEVRRIAPFFGMSAGEGGWRVAIVDTADEMNENAANALLKNLEEPPPQGSASAAVERAGASVAHHPFALPAARFAPARRSGAE